MADVTFRSGMPQRVDYTPTGGDVAQGQVVVLATVAANTTGAGMCLGIAERPISNNAKGALAYGGEWNGVAAGNYADWSKVFWDDTANKLTNSNTNNSTFGFISNRQSTSGDVTNAVVTAICWPFA